jgi:hypothetical protein
MILLTPIFWSAPMFLLTLIILSAPIFSGFYALIILIIC